MPSTPTDTADGTTEESANQATRPEGSQGSPQTADGSRDSPQTDLNSWQSLQETDSSGSPSEKDDEEGDGGKCFGKSTSRTGSVPWIPLSAGLQQKQSAGQLASWAALSLTLDGRDKITKLCQYLSRLLYWWIQSPRFKALQVSLTSSRKAFRLGRTLIELHKIQKLLASREKPQTSSEGRIPIRRASSNTGLGPSANLSVSDDAQTAESLGVHWMRSMRRSVYAPVESLYTRASLLWPNTVDDQGDSSLIMVESMVKLFGLAGFWAGDNVAFLLSSGALDNHQLLHAKDRMADRKRRQARASRFGNRSYFIGAVAGLLANSLAYWRYRRQLKQALIEQSLKEERAEADEPKECAVVVPERDRAMLFVLALALIKSSCDVLVFSNNAGIDLWERLAGFKMHEGFHCLCGLASASTVLYNNFPNKK